MSLMSIGSPGARRHWTANAILAALLALTCATGGCRAAGGGAASSADGASVEASSAERPTEIRVCVSGMVTPKEGIKYYEGLTNYVAKKAGVKARLIHKSEYAEVNKMLEEGKIDVAFVCSGPYVSGHDDFGLELLAAPVVNGAPQYHSYIIVGRDSPIGSLDELRGKTFAFTDPESNTGKLVPTYMLMKMGTTPEQFFGRFFYTYSHDDSIRAVAEGKADGAAVDSLIWEYHAETDAAYTSRTKIVARSGSYPAPPVVVRPGFNGELKAALKQAFLGAGDDSEGRVLLDEMNIDSFTSIDDSAYDSIRRMNEEMDGVE